MMLERTAKVVAAAGKAGAGWALLSAPDTLVYGANHVAGIETGPSPFDGGPTLALIGPDGQIHIVCNELEAGAAAVSFADCVHTYISLGFSDLRPLPQRYAEAVSAMLKAAKPSGPIAIESSSCPLLFGQAVEGTHQLVSFDQELWRARCIKSAEEIAALRRCAEATAHGQRGVPTAVVPGNTELSAWSDIRLAMESFAGTRVPVAGDFVTGRERTAKMGGPATDRIMGTGDPVIADLAPRVDGYWGDSCTTSCIGEACDGLKAMYAVVYDALQTVYDTLRPGMTAHDFDAPVRAIIHNAGYENTIHMGHGIGTSVHEWPRLVPGEQNVLQPGMVLMVEPGAYRSDIGGVRLEQMFLLTETGHEVLSPFQISPDFPIIS